MKRFIAALCISMMLVVSSGCGNDKTINGKTYETYGLLNKDVNADQNVKYQVITGNVVWGVLLFYTVAAPIYFFGFSMYEPVGTK